MYRRSRLKRALREAAVRGVPPARRSAAPIRLPKQRDRSYLWAMLRFLARFIGFWLVAAAVVFAVVDGAKSIAASGLVTTPVAEAWAYFAAAGTVADRTAEAPFNAPWPLDMSSRG